MALIITAGCGISQQGFDKWPTWPKYCVMTHNCTHVNVGGPASGNEHIARSVVRAIYDQTPDAVIVIWTSYNKLDVYIEDSAKELQVNNFPTRNFLIDYKGKIVNSPGWWPSSVSDDNAWKQFYNTTLASKTYYYIRTLENILSVQNLCKIKNIPCHMFLGYAFDFKFIKDSTELNYLYGAIDWTMFSELTPLEHNYQQSAWFSYNSTKAHGLIPVAGWHYEFYKNKIMPLLNQYFTAKPNEKFLNLEPEILRITQDRYEKKIS